MRGYGPVIRVDYETPTGEQVRDLFVALPAGGGMLRLEPAGRQFVGNSLRLTAPDVVTERGVSLVSLNPHNEAHQRFNQ